MHSQYSRLSMHLSGGNKRKLSAALAMLPGNKIVFLDEVKLDLRKCLFPLQPSSVMDPGARRQMWAVIDAERKQQVQFGFHKHLNFARDEASLSLPIRWTKQKLCALKLVTSCLKFCIYFGRNYDRRKPE